MATARRLRLRFDQRRSVLKLTCPARMSRKAALAWAADQRAWVDAQLLLAKRGIGFANGAVIPLEGSDVRLRWSAEAPRRPALKDGELICGGEAAGFARRIESYLKRHALLTLSGDTAEYAAKAGVSVRSVSVGDADTRWGSCSAEGRIRYSWRLILAPRHVRRFVAAHEVAHRVHLNHGPAFKTLEASLYESDVAQARSLLRSLGPVLKRIGRGA